MFYTLTYCFTLCFSGTLFCDDGINFMWKSEVKNNRERLTPPPVQNKHLLKEGERERLKNTWFMITNSLY